MSNKQIYLAADDYGTGGSWFAFRARSASEISSIYPEFQVYSPRPDWMEDEMMDGIIERGVWDIDEPATGLLKEYIRMRRH
ncbi:MAG: hypothetical protein KDC46_07100 [Thermoleophilia bacterium]|nr:hypothetical protein [Thermoleophilia bacterium]